MSEPANLTVSVVGLGPMGRGIARVFARAGARVSVVDSTPELTREGLGTIRAEAAAEGEELGEITANDLEGSVKNADLVIEAIVEDMAAKRVLFERIAAAARDDILIASNTSSLSVGEMGRALGTPERFVGLHFFNPPTKMRLVEVVAGPMTSSAYLERARALVTDLGKVAVVCRDSPNFIVNRVCRPLYYEAELLVTQGVEPAIVDAVACGALGHPMGPLTLLDFTGLHTHLGSSETALREFGDPRYRPIPIVRSLVRAGMTGRSAGRGFYDYAREKPRNALARVTRAPGSRSGATVLVIGPDAGRVPVDGAEAGADGSDATVTLYSCHRPPTTEDVQAVIGLAAAGPAVIDSSDATWANVLPVGVGWLRLHRSPTSALFAEVVRDDVAGIERTRAIDDVLDAFGAASVEVLALPGLIADRLALCMVNEALSIVEEGLAKSADVDTALTLGMAHKRGPFAHLAETGTVAAYVALRSMAYLTGDSRYRPGQLLRRQAAALRR